MTTVFHLNNREAKRELKIFNNGKLLPYCPTPTYLGVKLGQVAHFLSSPRGIAQETFHSRHTVEAACRLGMGCRSQNIANSRLVPGLLHS